MSNDPKSNNHEELRLRALLELEILDTAADSDFDNIVSLASKISGCPVSLISLIDKERQWFKAKKGVDVESTPRSVSFCTHAIEQDNAFVIPDATQDQRFSKNPLVISDPHIRFYAGMPLKTSTGYNLGTLCTIDTVPRKLTEDQVEQLQLLAVQAVRMMELRLANIKMVELQKNESRLANIAFLANNKALDERQKYLDVLEQLTIPLMLFEGPHHRIIFANESYIKTFSYSKSYIGKMAADIFNSDQNHQFLEILDSVYKTGNSVSKTEVLIKSKDKNGKDQDVYLDFTYAAKRNTDDDIEGVLAVIVDVTEKVLDRKKIEKNQEVLTQVVNFMPQMTFEADKTGAVTSYNQRWYDYIGEVKDTEGWGWKDKNIHHPDDAVMTLETWQKAISSGSMYEMEYRLRRNDGEYRWHLGRAIPIKDPSGEILYWFGTNTDIHDQRMSAEKIKYNERMLSLVTNSLPALVSYLDRNLSYQFVNSAYEKWFNKDSSEFLGKKVSDLVDESFYNRIKPKFDKALSGEAVEFDDEGHFPAGHKYLHISYTPDIDDSGYVRGIVALVRDVSYKRNIEKQLVLAKEMAEAANEAKSAFLANMSHEIRTPIGAIMGFSDLARQPDTTVQDVANYLSIIERNSVQVLRIIDDILDLAKVEAGKIDVELLEFPLTEFLADFTSMMGFRARENGIAFNIVADTQLPQVITSDPTRLRQILTNAVGNAIKFTSNGKVALHVSWLNEKLYFSVIDTGRGISPEQAQKLFQVFVQADVSTTRQYGGTGLGLVLTKKLCQVLGGDYILEHSELGVGSKFVASVAANIPESAAIIDKNNLAFQSAAVLRATSDQGRLNNVKVLVVDDSNDNQVLVRIFLEKQGAHISIASDGSEGVKKALAEDFDVVLMDIQMPIMDGYEAVKKLRARGFKKPVIAFTAHAMKEESERARKSGFTSFLSKPIQKDTLIETIAKVHQRNSH